MNRKERRRAKALGLPYKEPKPKFEIPTHNMTDAEMYDLLVAKRIFDAENKT
jgi:hypothetical protein